MNKKLINRNKRPSGVGAVAPASPAPKPAADNYSRLLTILERNVKRATEPELVQRLRDAIRAVEARRG
jgi:hypothetical protein